jgi:hypothetical protein
MEAHRFRYVVREARPYRERGASFGAMEVAVHIPDACNGMGRRKCQLLTFIEIYMHVPKTGDGKICRRRLLPRRLSDHDWFASDEDGILRMNCAGGGIDDRYITHQ